VRPGAGDGAAARSLRHDPCVTHAMLVPLASSVDAFMTALFAFVLAAGYIALWVIWRLFFRGRGDEPPGFAADDEGARPRDDVDPPPGAKV
jgi:hypothetical protein